MIGEGLGEEPRGLKPWAGGDLRVAAKPHPLRWVPGAGSTRQTCARAGELLLTRPFILSKEV